MLSRANFLILDEPTNHLDVESIEALEDALRDFDGTLLLISHDCALLDALTERIWHLDHGTVEDFPGNFAEWDMLRAERLAREERARQEEAEQRRTDERRDARRRDAAQRVESSGLRALRN